MRSRATLPAAAAFLVVCLTGKAGAQGPARLDSVVTSLMRRDAVPGVALAVVRGDSLIALGGWGVARVSDSVPVDPARTIFRLASVAKLFVATAAMQAVSDGKLDLRSDVNTHLRDWKVPSREGGPITLHHLLTHTAGFDERVIGYAARSSDSIPPLGVYLGRNLPHRGWPAGVVTGYSNHGMAFAAHLVEVTSGLPFGRYAAQRIFQPLGMTSTHYVAVPDSERPRLARGHFCDEASCDEAPDIFSNPFPVGLAYSTALDMSRFLRSMTGTGGPRVLSPDAQATMWRVQFVHDSLVAGMSYGFFNQAWRGWHVLAHSGNVPGMNSLLLVVPDARLGIYFVANGGRSRFGEALRDSLLQMFLPGQRDVTNRRTIALSPDYLRSLIGPYQMTRYAHRTIERFPSLFATAVSLSRNDGGRLVLPSPNGTREYEPIDSLHFQEVRGERVIAFRRGSDGRVTHFFAAAPVFGADLPAAFEKLAWHDAPFFMNEYVSWLLLGPAIVLGAWPVTAVIAWLVARRRRRVPLPARRARWTALGVAITFNALWVAFGFLFIARSTRMLGRGEGLALGVSLEMWMLSRLAFAIAFLAAVLVGTAVYAWERRLWDFPRRIEFTVLAVAAGLVVAFLVRWNYLPPRL